ncbi:MAG: hypothetical protein WA154_14025 [Moraxellaceae bacterium]
MLKIPVNGSDQLPAMTQLTQIEQLRCLSTDELQALFNRLDAPQLADMDGEYRAEMLAQPYGIAGQVGKLFLDNPIQTWLCKAFRPVNAHYGRGYNTFWQSGEVVQRYPMLTTIAASRYDGRPAYTLIYRYFHSICGLIHMVDEVRQVAPDLYLGMGTYGFTRGQRQIAWPFLLEKTDTPYRQDIGKRSQGFVISARELPAGLPLLVQPQV